MSAIADICFMEYSQNYLREWLISHSALSIRKLEKQAGLPLDTVRHFIKNRRGLGSQHLKCVEGFLKDYGYTPLTSE